MSTVTLLSGTQKRNADGHPWIYRNQIERIEGPVSDGDVVDVADSRGRYIGTGLYNNRSMITIRLVSRRHELIDEALIRSRVRAAIEYRQLFSRDDTDSGRMKTRHDIISAQKSWITDYKAGRISLENFKQKVLQYTE